MTSHEWPISAPGKAPPTMAPEDRAGAEEGPARQRFLLTLAYDGHAFHGWQRQLPPDRPPLRTVQGELEATLKTVLKQPIRTLGASRTDARVHATGQRVQFDATTRIPPERLGKAINDRLPDDMELRQLQVVPDNFDVIGGVVSKQYRYRIFNADHRPLAIRHMVYHCWYDLDVERMKAAAQRLVGTYDVAGFAAAGHGRQNTARTIHRLEVIPNAPEIQLFFEGSGFLWHQVRIMAGTLVEVGRGKFAIEHMDRIRETADRREAGPTLPPEGLSLEWIQYPQKAFLPDEPTPTHAEEHRARNTPNTPTPSTQHPDTPGAKDQP